jgi:hypothetical protein
VTEDEYGELRETYTNFAGVSLRVLANQLIPFYIMNPLF